MSFPPIKCCLTVEALICKSLGQSLENMAEPGKAEASNDSFDHVCRASCDIFGGWSCLEFGR